MQTDNNAPKSSARLPSELRLVWVGVVLLTLLSVLFVLIEFLCHMPALDYRALSPPGEHFTDFSIYQPKFILFHTVAFFHRYFPFTYPAPVALVYEFFFRCFRHPTVVFVAFTASALLVPAALFARALHRRGIAASTAWLFVLTMALCSWPYILVIDRANMEILVWIALATAIWAFATGRGFLAATLFGIAAALKLFPFVFLALFLSMRRYRELVFGVAVFLVLSIISLAALGPTVPIAVHGIASGLDYFKIQYMQRWRPWESGVDHSLFAFLKFVAIATHEHSTDIPFTRSLRIYTAVTAVGGIILYFWRIQFLPLLNQILVLCIVSIYLTAFSGDGTLLHLYYPFALLAFLAISAQRRGIVVPGLRQALLLLAFLFSYEGFFSYGSQRLEGEAKCIALGWLLLLALRFPFGPPLRAAGPSSLLAGTDGVPV